jgi:mono/diheme cytochrome c family protein
MNNNNFKIILLIMIMPLSSLSSDIDEGKKLYLNQGCYGCHGYNGTGRYPLAGDVSGIMTNKDLFITFLRLRADINPINPSNNMPNYSKSMIDDKEAELLYDYINTFEDNPLKLEDIPVLKEILESATRKNNEKNN